MIPIRLASFVKTFGLGIESKQYFPHGWNEKKNLDKDLWHLPDKKHYAPESMMPEEREVFEKWYRANYHEPFCLKDKLAEYCYNGKFSIKIYILNAFFRCQNPDTRHDQNEGVV
jgi:hypothetical protein